MLLFGKTDRIWRASLLYTEVSTTIRVYVYNIHTCKHAWVYTRLTAVTRHTRTYRDENDAKYCVPFSHTPLPPPSVFVVCTGKKRRKQSSGTYNSCRYRVNGWFTILCVLYTMYARAYTRIIWWENRKGRRGNRPPPFWNTLHECADTGLCVVLFGYDLIFTCYLDGEFSIKTALSITSTL